MIYFFLLGKILGTRQLQIRNRREGYARSVRMEEAIGIRYVDARSNQGIEDDDHCENRLGQQVSCLNVNLT